MKHNKNYKYIKKLLINNRIRHFPLQEYKTIHIQATSITLTDTNTTISSIYSPPRHNITKSQYLTFFSTLDHKFIAAGDYNAKHTHWGSRLTTPKGRQLISAITSAKLDVISGGQPTYWPSNLKKVPDLIDFAVIKNVKREQLSFVSSHDLSSDHSPTIMNFLPSFPIPELQTNCLPNSRTNWLKYKMYVSSHLPQNPSLKSEFEIQSAVDELSNILSSAVKVSTPQIQKKYKGKYKLPIRIEDLISEKRKLRRQW